MAFEKMNKVLDVDLQNMMIEVQAGIVTNEINATVADDGLFFAGYPMSLSPARSVATSPKMPAAASHQVWRDKSATSPAWRWSHRLSDIIKIGGKIVKDVSGYDLKLYIGSEGARSAL